MAKCKVNDRVVVRSKYFNPFNDLEGSIVEIDDHYEKFTVKIDGRDDLQVFDRLELKGVQP